MVKESETTTLITEKQTVNPLNRLKISPGYQFTKEEVAHKLEATSIPNSIAKNGKKTIAKLREREVKNTPHPT